MSHSIELSEYQDTLVTLCPDDVTFIATVLTPRMSLRRDLGSDAVILNPNQHVGVVTLPSGKRLVSYPKVPIGSLFWMLAVAYQLPSPFRDEVAGFDRFEDVFEFVAHYFHDLVHQRIRTGLYRRYVDRHDNLGVLRGRIAVAEDIRRNYVHRQRVFCEFTEYSWDIPENQLLRQTVWILHGFGFRDGLVQRLRTLDATMAEVTPTTLPVSVLDRFEYSRLNDDYRTLHAFCRLFLEGASLSERSGEYAFQTFLIDMNRLFEEFIAQAVIERAPPEFHVRTQQSIYLGEGQQIAMRPDIVMSVGERPFSVADTKYKRTEVGDVIHADYYQVLAYCTAMGVRDGVIIYPMHEQRTDRTTQVEQSPVVIRQRTIDLSGSVADLQHACDCLVDTLCNSHHWSLAT